MSHYDIDYTNVPNAEDKAIADTVDWLGGQERFDKVNVELRTAVEQGATLAWVQLALSFAGVRGFPAKVWYDRLKAEVEKNSLAGGHEPS